MCRSHNAYARQLNFKIVARQNKTGKLANNVFFNGPRQSVKTLPGIPRTSGTIYEIFQKKLIYINFIICVVHLS